ncbi:hypothetical protein [Streptomyces shenzhenensis]|uniref:hypothetical protein n=1 Tax=Streptomyces shenzhenensis TaxID=943815 RepID=UPI00340EFE16
MTFERLGRTMARRRRWVIGLAVAFLALGGIRGTRVFGSLTTGGPTTRPARARARSHVPRRRFQRAVTQLFSISGITFIKLIGVAMLVAVLVDADDRPGTAGTGHDAPARKRELVGACASAALLRPPRSPGRRRPAPHA